MKKSQLLIFCSLVSSTCFAQFQKNDRLLSGQIHFNNGTNKNISNNAQATNWSTGINISSFTPHRGGISAVKTGREELAAKFLRRLLHLFRAHIAEVRGD